MNHVFMRLRAEIEELRGQLRDADRRAQEAEDRLKQLMAPRLGRRRAAPNKGSSPIAGPCDLAAPGLMGSHAGTRGQSIRERDDGDGRDPARRKSDADAP